jgi:hypothetical protein
VTHYKVIADDKWPDLIRREDFTPDKYKERTESPWGPFTVLLLFVPASINTLFFDNDGIFFEALSAIWLVIASVFIIYTIYRRQKGNDTAIQSANQAFDVAKRNRLKQADDLSIRCNNLLQETERIQKGLPECLKRAEFHVKRALSEYTDNAYTPFWDQIAHATKSVDAYYEGLGRLNSLSEAYGSSLKGKNHDFPVFPITNRVYNPDPAILIRTLKDTIRKGQRKFEFASIYEQRAGHVGLDRWINMR